MGFDSSGGKVLEQAVRFNGDNYLQFKHRFGRRYVFYSYRWNLRESNLETFVQIN